jgi:CheY-like chemotaxis protein
VYSSMLLAAWYKRSLKESLLGKVYANKAKVKGIDQDPKANEEIYQQYLKAFKKGVFNYIKEDVDRYTHEAIPRKYFSGGATHGFASDAQWKAGIRRAPASMLRDDFAMNGSEIETAVVDFKTTNEAAMNATILNQAVEAVKLNTRFFPQRLTPLQSEVARASAEAIRPLKVTTELLKPPLTSKVGAPLEFKALQETGMIDAEGLLTDDFWNEDYALPRLSEKLGRYIADVLYGFVRQSDLYQRLAPAEAALAKINAEERQAKARKKSEDLQFAQRKEREFQNESQERADDIEASKTREQNLRKQIASLEKVIARQDWGWSFTRPATRFVIRTTWTLVNIFRAKPTPQMLEEESNRLDRLLGEQESQTRLKEGALANFKKTEQAAINRLYQTANRPVEQVTLTDSQYQSARQAIQYLQSVEFQSLLTRQEQVQMWQRLPFLLQLNSFLAAQNIAGKQRAVYLYLAATRDLTIDDISSEAFSIKEMQPLVNALRVSPWAFKYTLENFWEQTYPKYQVTRPGVYKQRAEFTRAEKFEGYSSITQRLPYITSAIANDLMALGVSSDHLYAYINEHHPIQGAEGPLPSQPANLQPEILSRIQNVLAYWDDLSWLAERWTKEQAGTYQKQSVRGLLWDAMVKMSTLKTTKRSIRAFVEDYTNQDQDGLIKALEEILLYQRSSSKYYDGIIEVYQKWAKDHRQALLAIQETSPEMALASWLVNGPEVGVSFNTVKDIIPATTLSLGGIQGGLLATPGVVWENAGFFHKERPFSALAKSPGDFAMNSKEQLAATYETIKALPRVAALLGQINNGLDFDLNRKVNDVFRTEYDKVGDIVRAIEEINARSADRDENLDDMLRALENDFGRRLKEHIKLVLKDKEILVVEDHELVGPMMVAVVNSFGGKATLVTDGRKALELLKSQKFDGVISDVDMPHKDGKQLAEEMNADPVLTKIPKIFHTGKIFAHGEFFREINVPAYGKPVSNAGLMGALVDEMVRLNPDLTIALETKPQGESAPVSAAMSAAEVEEALNNDVYFDFDFMKEEDFVVGKVDKTTQWHNVINDTITVLASDDPEVNSLIYTYTGFDPNEIDQDLLDKRKETYKKALVKATARLVHDLRYRNEVVLNDADTWLRGSAVLTRENFRITPNFLITHLMYGDGTANMELFFKVLNFYVLSTLIEETSDPHGIKLDKTLLGLGFNNVDLRNAFLAWEGKLPNARNRAMSAQMIDALVKEKYWEIQHLDPDGVTLENTLSTGQVAALVDDVKTVLLTDDSVFLSNLYKFMGNPAADISGEVRQKLDNELVWAVMMAIRDLRYKKEGIRFQIKDANTAPWNNGNIYVSGGQLKLANGEPIIDLMYDGPRADLFARFVNFRHVYQLLNLRKMNTFDAKQLQLLGLAEEEIESAQRAWQGELPPQLVTRRTAAMKTAVAEQRVQDPSALGGIDLNAANVKLNIKRDGKGVPLPIAQQDLENIKIEGLIPIILRIAPAATLPMFSELKNSSPAAQG